MRGPTKDGKGVSVLRARDDRLELGDLRPLEHGKPIQGEVVSLHPRKECPLLCDVEVKYAAEPAVPSSELSGPPQVASDRYRRNWELIWAKPAKKRSAPN